MVTIACPQEAVTVYKVAMESVLVHAVRDTATFAKPDDRAKRARGAVGARNRDAWRPARADPGGAGRRRACVLDADALSVFEDGADLLFERIRAPAS